MLTRQVLAALATGISANDDDAARAALRSGDPIARRFARRKLERSLIDAALVTGSTDHAHVMRVAALSTAKHVQIDPHDVTGVAAAYATLPARNMPRFPLWTLLAVLVTASLAGSIAYVVATLPTSKSRVFARPLPPPSAFAFKQGGVPLREPALDTLLGRQLTDLVVEAGRAKDSDRRDITSIVKPIRDPAAVVTHGPALAHAWRDMIDAFERSIRAAQAREDIDRTADHLREAVRETSAQLADAGLGYFLEGRFKSGYPFIQAYRVEQVGFVVAGGVPRRVLSLRRLDLLNTSYALLGMQSEDIGDPVVLLDQIDENVASTVLPVVAPGASYPLADRDWLASEIGKSLAMTIGATVRDELAAALANDSKDATRIAALLVERGIVIDEWRVILDHKKMTMVRTDDLFVPDGLLDHLDGIVPSYQRKRVAAIDDELAELEAPRVASRIQEIVEATVRRHEAQHGFDDDRDTELRYPTALSDLLGPPHDGQGQDIPVVRSARAELSAYLSQIANDPVTPQLALWNLGRQAFTRDRWGTGESYVAIVILEGLARHLGATVDGRPFHRGIDRERLASYAKRIAQSPATAVHAAAAALWQDLYGEPLTKIIDTPPHAVIASAR